MLMFVDPANPPPPTSVGAFVTMRFVKLPALPAPKLSPRTNPVLRPTRERAVAFRRVLDAVPTILISDIPPSSEIVPTVSLTLLALLPVSWIAPPFETIGTVPTRLLFTVVALSRYSVPLRLICALDAMAPLAPLRRIMSLSRTVVWPMYVLLPVSVRVAEPRPLPRLTRFPEPEMTPLSDIGAKFRSSPPPVPSVMLRAELNVVVPSAAVLASAAPLLKVIELAEFPSDESRLSVTYSAPPLIVTPPVKELAAVS